MQHALGVAGGAGGVDGVGGVVQIGFDIACERVGVHHIFPVVGAKLRLTAAVLADIGDTLGRVGVLYQRPCGAGFPYADHGDDRQYAARQVDEDKVLLPYAFLFEIGIDASAHFVELRVGDAFGVGVVIQDRRAGFFFGVLLQQCENVAHSVPQ